MAMAKGKNLFERVAALEELIGSLNHRLNCMSDGLKDVHEAIGMEAEEDDDEDVSDEIEAEEWIIYCEPRDNVDADDKVYYGGLLNKPWKQRWSADPSNAFAYGSREAAYRDKKLLKPYSPDYKQPSVFRRE